MNFTAVLRGDWQHKSPLQGLLLIFMFCWYKSYYAFSRAGKNSHSNPMHICKVSENRGASPPQCCFQEMLRNNCTGAGRKGEGGYSQFFCRLLLLWGPNPFQLSSIYTVAIQFWCKVQTFSHFEEVPVTPPSSTAKKNSAKKKFSTNTVGMSVLMQESWIGLGHQSSLAGKGEELEGNSQVSNWVVLKSSDVEEGGKQLWWNWRRKWSSCCFLFVLLSNQK